MSETTDEKLNALLDQVLDGSEEAAQELFQNYEPYLLDAIRKRLYKKLRPKFDSIDFAQDVWASFFAKLPQRRTFKNHEELISYLTSLAHYKVAEVLRQRFRLKKYNVNRECSLDDSRRFEKEALSGPQQTPSEIVSKRETWEEFLRKQPPAYQRVLILLQQRKTYEEVAQDLNISVRTVERIVARIATRLNS